MNHKGTRMGMGKMNTDFKRRNEKCRLNFSKCTNPDVSSLNMLQLNYSVEFDFDRTHRQT